LNSFCKSRLLFVGVSVTSVTLFTFGCVTLFTLLGVLIVDFLTETTFVSLTIDGEVVAVAVAFAVDLLLLVAISSQFDKQ
jgi:hypothetical protein